MKERNSAKLAHDSDLQPSLESPIANISFSPLDPSVYLLLESNYLIRLLLMTAKAVFFLCAKIHIYLENKKIILLN